MDSNNMPYRPSTLAIVTNSQGQYLLVQTNQYQPNECTFPGGGIDPGETPQQAIQRELEEEILSVHHPEGSASSLVILSEVKRSRRIPF